MNTYTPDTGLECPVCFEAIINNEVLNCGHKIHKECIIRSGQKRCPLCRQEVTILTSHELKRLNAESERLNIVLPEDISELYLEYEYEDSRSATLEEANEAFLEVDDDYLEFRLYNIDDDADSTMSSGDYEYDYSCEECGYTHRNYSCQHENESILTHSPSGEIFILRA